MIDIENFSDADQLIILKQILDKFIPTAKKRVPLEAFLAVMPRILSVPVELGVFNRRGKMFVIPRLDNDPEYPPGGLYHNPGSVLLPGEEVNDALNRIIKTDLGGAVSLDDVIMLSWHRTMKGIGSNQNPTRDEVHLLHAVVVDNTFMLPSDGVWIDDPGEIKVDMIPHHYSLVVEIASQFLASSSW